MATSYLRPAASRPPLRSLRRAPRRRRAPYVALALVLVLIGAAGAAAIVLKTSHGRLTVDPVALAKLSTPVGGGRIEDVSATTGVQDKALPVALRGDEVWPTVPVAAGAPVSVYATIVRPSAFAWLTGRVEHLQLSFTAPKAVPTQQFLTVTPGSMLRVRFTVPVRVVDYGAAPRLTSVTLPSSQSQVSVPRPTPAGSMSLAAAVRSWEIPTPTMISWFPAGTATAAVASPAPGTVIGPDTPITLTFSKTVAQALGTARPPVLPITPGIWHQVNAHTIVFRPTGFGYGLGAHVTVPLPADVRLVGAGSTGTWNVPGGSTVRLQQLLANLGYLPLTFTPAGAAPALTPQAQVAAAIKPPAGTFNWAYPNVPSQLHGLWAPGANGVMTKGAVMAFEDDHGLTTDGDPGRAVWQALITATLENKRSTFGYTYVVVDKESSPEQLTLWHSGHTVLTAPVNTGVAAAPTVDGIFPVFEHLLVTTMTGTNPDGSHYSDPGIRWVSYFNGGDALHEFPRAGYGYPQSDGCVEMTNSDAEAVYPYTPIGTLVEVE